MLSFNHFTTIILFLILAPIVGAITLLFTFVFEKKFDLLNREAKQIELEKELQQAKYHQLNEQIKPHFLFNTLNVILSLARLNRTDELIRALEVFSLFLKFKYKTTQQLVPLSEELKYTKYYLDIQKIRFGSRLEVTIDVPEECSLFLIPPFVLQTLVENAFKHAFEKQEGLAKLTVVIIEKNDQVQLTVSDNGKYSGSANDEAISGHGLDNIRRRLKLCFGHLTSLDIYSAQTGTMVMVKWPKVTNLHL